MVKVCLGPLIDQTNYEIDVKEWGIVIGNVGFAGVKGFGGGFDRFMMPMFGEKMNKEYVRAATEESLRLDQALVRLDKQGQDGEEIKKIVLLHYSPIKATVQGEPEELFPFLGSSHLVEPLERRETAPIIPL